MEGEGPEAVAVVRAAILGVKLGVYQTNGGYDGYEPDWKEGEEDVDVDVDVRAYWTVYEGVDGAEHGESGCKDWVSLDYVLDCC